MESTAELAMTITMCVSALAAIILYIAAVVSIHKTKFSTYNQKAVWLTLVLTMPVLGSLFYFYQKRRRDMFIRL